MINIFFGYRPAIDFDNPLRWIEHERVRNADAVELLEHGLVADYHGVIDAVRRNKGLDDFQSVIIKRDADDLCFRAGRDFLEHWYLAQARLAPCGPEIQDHYFTLKRTFLKGSPIDCREREIR